MNGITLISLNIYNYFLTSINTLILIKKEEAYVLLVREITKKSTREQRLWLLAQARRRQCRNPDRQTHHRRLHTGRRRPRPRPQTANLRRRRRLRTKRRRWREIETGGGE